MDDLHFVYSHEAIYNKMLRSAMPVGGPRKRLCRNRKEVTKKINKV